MRGIDISHYQNGLDIQSIGASGYEFAILKITEGTTLTDAAAPHFYMQAKEAGIPVGGYCYSHATAPDAARAEAAFMVKQLRGFPMPLGLYLDVEAAEMLALPNDKLLAVADAWCEAIREAGYIPGVYGSEYNLWAKLDPDALPEDVIVWIAHYGAAPDLPCDLWQYSDDGRVAGYNGPVDTDDARSERFRRMVRGDDPVDWPCEKRDLAAAAELLAAYLQTEEFARNFIDYVERRREK